MDFMGLGLKQLTFYSSMGLYAVSAVYLLALLVNKFQGESSGSSGKKRPKSGQYTVDDIIKLSQESDAYESAQEPYTAEFMADLAVQIGEKYELEPQDLESLRVAALLHDVGQMERYDFINEGRALRSEEWKELEEHPVYGYRYIIENLGEEYQLAARWVRWHHERWDGTGYPDRLAGEQIPLPARILAVVDAYCAMSQERPHRQAMSPERVMAELESESGLRFDPQIIELFGVGDAQPQGTALEV